MSFKKIKNLIGNKYIRLSIKTFVTTLILLFSISLAFLLFKFLKNIPNNLIKTEGKFIFTYSSKYSNSGHAANTEITVINGKIEKTKYDTYYPLDSEIPTSEPGSDSSETTDSSTSVSSSDPGNSGQTISPIYPGVPSTEYLPDIYMYDLRTNQMKLISLEEAQEYTVYSRYKSNKGYLFKVPYEETNFIKSRIIGKDDYNVTPVLVNKYFKKNLNIDLNIEYPGEISFIGWINE